MERTNLSASQRRAIRRSANESYNTRIPIRIVPGIALAPRSVGEGWHYETTGGTRIYHPSAYSRKGWSNMRYIPSSRRIEVGELWVASL